MTSREDAGTPSAGGRGFALTTDQTLLALLAIGLFACGATAVMQDDSWWHLRCGQLIWALGHVPKHDPFSFVLGPEAHWPNHEWLAQVLLYGAYSLGGLPLVNVGIGVLSAAAGLLLLGAMTGPLERRGVLLALVLPWTVAALSVRPQVWTLCALALVMWLLVRRRYAWLPLVFLLWANLHGAVALGGLLMVGACLAAAMIARARLVSLLIATTLCGLATLGTPLGVEILTFPLESVGRLKQLDLTEWNAPGFSQPLHLYFWALLTAFAGVVALRRSWLRQWPDGMLVANAALFAVLATMSERNVPLFLMVAAVAVARVLDAAARPATPPVGVPEKPDARNVRLVAGFALAATGGLAWAFAAPWERLQWQPMSPGAVAAVRACPQPTFNTYNVGGYLLWFTPEREVFIDSRQDPYPVDLLAATIRSQQTGRYAELFARYGFEAAVMEPKWPLGRTLRAAGWREAYRDEQWLVLRRPAGVVAGATVERSGEQRVQP